MSKPQFEELFNLFIRKMKSEFNTSFQKKLNGIIGGSIIRGTSPSLSHVFEDNFADFLYNLFKEKDYKYLIDVNLSVKINSAKSTQYKPDILVIEKRTSTIKAIFELKIDDARANDEWVKDANQKLDILKAVSSYQDKTNNYIKYRIIKVDELGLPITNRAGKIQHHERTLSCSPNARVACLALCKENSRKKTDGTYRTTGDMALYISDKHFNNQNYSLEDLMDSNNLNTYRLEELINQMGL